MKRSAPVLEAFVRKYERSLAGRTGNASRDVLVNVEELLREADAADGDAREVAEQQLQEAEKAGILKLVPLHRRDRASIHQVRFCPTDETILYDYLGRESPKSIREALAKQFGDSSEKGVPMRWREGWKAWCERLRIAALAGKSVTPFNRHPSEENGKLLTLLRELLGWEGESLVRFASCVLCGDSKTLESLASTEPSGQYRDKLRGKLGCLLDQVTNGEICSLDDLGILRNPRFALIHGPVKLRLDEEWLDIGRLHGAVRLAEADIERAECVISSALRCLTVENETSFHELAKLQSGTLLIQTSYPGSGTLKLLQRLPDKLEFWHFGDSDEAGFEILRVLREKSGRDFRPIHMQRGRIPFEQESLGRPSIKQWPFYDPK